MKAELVLGNLKRERDALDKKLERLEQALSKEWQDGDQEYLCSQQYNAMCLYAHILDERIIDIEYKLEHKKAKDETVDMHETSHCDKNIFNAKIDPESYRKCMESCCDEYECDSCENAINLFIDIVKGIYGEDSI